MVPGAALGLSAAAAVAPDGGVPMMSGMRMAGREPGVVLAAPAPAAAAAEAGFAAGVVEGCAPVAEGAVDAAAPAAGVDAAAGVAAAALAASSFCFARFARCCSASLESDMV